METKAKAGKWLGDIFIDPYGYCWVTGSDLMPHCIGKEADVMPKLKPVIAEAKKA